LERYFGSGNREIPGDNVKLSSPNELKDFVKVVFPIPKIDSTSILLPHFALLQYNG